MGFTSPPKQEAAPAPAPIPESDRERGVESRLDDPNARARAAERARQAQARVGRQKLRIPLESTVGSSQGRSGLQI